MIVFSSLSLKRGQIELLKNATATINPKQKVGLVCKNGCGRSSLFTLLLFTLLKKELTPEGGEVTYPSLATFLVEQGYENVFSVIGGFDGWEKAGLPVEKNNE